MHPIERWHQVVVRREAPFDELLAPDVVFRSPVVHRPVEGRDATAVYLAAAYEVLGTPAFRYEREIVGERHAALVFVTEIDGTHVHGVDLVHWDDDGRVTEVTVMIRPKRAFDLVHQLMGAQLARMAGGGDARDAAPQTARG